MLVVRVLRNNVVNIQKKVPDCGYIRDEQNNIKIKDIPRMSIESKEQLVEKTSSCAMMARVHP